MCSVDSTGSLAQSRNTATEIRDAADKLAGLLGKAGPTAIQGQQGNPLTPPDAFCNIVGTSSVFNHMKAEPEFHAEWLRDEPYDATATDPGSYIPGAWCQLSPGNREHGIRNARSICCIRFPIASFPISWKKRPFVFLGRFFEARPRLLAEEQGFKVARFQGFNEAKRF